MQTPPNDWTVAATPPTEAQAQARLFKEALQQTDSNHDGLLSEQEMVARLGIMSNLSIDLLRRYHHASQEQSVQYPMREMLAQGGDRVTRATSETDTRPVSFTMPDNVLIDETMLRKAGETMNLSAEEAQAALRAALPLGVTAIRVSDVIDRVEAFRSRPLPNGQLEIHLRSDERAL